MSMGQYFSKGITCFQIVSASDFAHDHKTQWLQVQLTSPQYAGYLTIFK